ncbi:MAG: cystathionine gamma-synthase [Planctomycetes bacterium]|jgi:cystathionine beta-lyase/cystathionine gamma-synthase|nr:cystathionine gamma-synthase [Planctomycetota bacterium]MDP6425129.1 cystathionine gamma-synthase [Planctomycetota bacterium]
MSLGKSAGFATRAIHAGQRPDPTTGAIMTPIYLTSTYVQEEPAKTKGFDYSRTVNPTRQALEANLASLENARFGRYFASGMASIDCVCNLLAAGNHVVAGNDLYGGTYRLFTTLYQKLGIDFTFVDSTNPDNVREALRGETRMVFLETPSNPLLRVTDLAAISEMVHASGNVLVVVDNTFATPYLQNPLDLGADIVTHSATKYLGGHSDVVGGCLCHNDEALDAKLHHFQNSVGATASAIDCFLMLRSTKTLHLRMDRHCDNAEHIARWLEEHERVERVIYPGLPSHPQHELASRQMRRAGGMVSLELVGGLEAGRQFASRTQLFSLAESLGGVESLVDHPASMTHASIPREERQKAGLADGLVRLSVGVEDVDDLIADLDEALKA